MSLFRRKRPSGESPAAGSGESETPAGNEEERPQGAPAVHEGPAEGVARAQAPEGEGEGEGAETPGELAEGEGPAEEPRRGLIASTIEALAPVQKRHVLVASIGLMGFAAAGVLLFSAASFWWTSQPAFCGRCHVMTPYVRAWEQSPHQDVNCESCHLTPGFFGFLGGKIAGLQVVMNYIRGEYHDYSFSAAVSNGSCLQCHESILARNIHRDGIAVSHENIIGMGGKCVSCHSTVAHGSAVPPGSATHPTMDKCLVCHNDEIAPLQCSLCHTGRQSNAAEPPSSTSTAAPGT